MTYRYSPGPSRMLWVQEATDTRTPVLKGCTHTLKPDDSPGYMRLGRAIAPSAELEVDIDVEGHLGAKFGDVREMVWDEESGRICAIVQEDMSSSLIVIDFI